jgi:hypothetical protein
MPARDGYGRRAAQSADFFFAFFFVFFFVFFLPEVF